VHTVKIQHLLLLVALSVVTLVAVCLGIAGPALATSIPPPVRVSGPSTLALLSLGVAAAAIGARFINRR
jgi:hypothetical protein